MWRSPSTPLSVIIIIRLSRRWMDYAVLPNTLLTWSFNMRLRSFTLAFATVGCLAATAALPARAQQTIYSSGFESPTYHTGSLYVQDGWVEANSISPNKVTVQNSIARSGTQALQIDAAGIPAGQENAKRDFGYDPLGSGTPVVTLSFDMYLTSAGTQAAGWTMAALNPTEGILSVVAVLSNNSLIALNSGAYVPLGVTITRDTWHTYSMQLDFGNKNYDVYYDGVLVGSDLGFMDTAPTTSIVGLVGVQSAGSGTDKGYFDNVLVTSAPEPGSVVLLGLALPLVGLVRRRRS